MGSTTCSDPGFEVLQPLLRLGKQEKGIPLYFSGYRSSEQYDEPLAFFLPSLVVYPALFTLLLGLLGRFPVPSCSTCFSILCGWLTTVIDRQRGCVLWWPPKQTRGVTGSVLGPFGSAFMYNWVGETNWIYNLPGCDVSFADPCLRRTLRITCLLVGWLVNVPATCLCISGTDLHRQFLRAATLRWKLHVKLSTSPSHSLLTPGRPVPALTL